MIITRTPLRIEFTGGSDLPAFSRLEKGAIVNATIDKFVYIFTSPSLLPSTRPNRLALLTCKYLKISDVNIGSFSDLPQVSGLGSSGSFLVGLLQALHALKGEKTPPKQLAQEAYHVERDLAGIKCGAQDQYAAAFGDIRYHEFYQGSVKTKIIPCSDKTKKLLQNRLLLFYIGRRRPKTNFLQNLWITLENSKKKRELMARRVKLSQSIARNLAQNSLDSFGQILDEEWALKKAIAPIETTRAIDLIYEKGKKAGALGGKLLGAGGGGFFLFYAPEEKHPVIKKALSPLVSTPFKFTSFGSEIIHSDPKNQKDEF